MSKKITLALIFWTGSIFIDSTGLYAQFGVNIDTFLVRSERPGDYRASFEDKRFIALFKTFKYYKFGSETMLIVSEKESDQKKLALLRQKYKTAQLSWNVYLDALQEYIKEFPTIKQDFINRNELLRIALENMRDFLLYYRKHFSHLHMYDLLYKKKSISDLIDYFNEGHYLFEHYEKQGLRGTKEDFTPHVTSVYWKPWEDVLEEAHRNNTKE